MASQSHSFVVDYVQSQQISTNACILTFQVVKHVETHTYWTPWRRKSHGDRFHDLQPPNLMPTSMVVPWSLKVIGGFCVATCKASLLKSPTSNQGSYVWKKLQPFEIFLVKFQTLIILWNNRVQDPFRNGYTMMYAFKVGKNPLLFFKVAYFKETTSSCFKQPVFGGFPEE